MGRSLQCLRKRANPWAPERNACRAGAHGLAATFARRQWSRYQALLPDVVMVSLDERLRRSVPRSPCARNPLDLK